MNKISVVARWVLIGALACLTFACSSLSATHDQSASAPTPVASLAAPPLPPPQNPEDKMPRIDPAEAKQQVAAGKAIIIDVRGPDAYKLAHIKGSLDHSLSRLESKDFEGLPKNKQIIAYCT